MAPRVPTPLAIGRARKRYDAGAPLAVLAKGFGVTEATFRKWRKMWDWPARQPVWSDAAAPSVSAEPHLLDVACGMADKPSDEPDPPDTPRLIHGVRRAIEAELKALSAQCGNPRGGEARARALTNLTRTLTLVRDLETQVTQVQRKAGTTDHDDADAPPVDVAQLRHELARRLHQLSQDGDDP